MGELAALVGGVLLLATASVDSLATTLVVRSGAGPLTRRLTNALWRLALRTRRGEGGSVPLAVVGGALLLTTVFTWVVLLWAGWMLVFLSGDPGVIDAETLQPAGWLDIAYFAGFTVFTLGVGDFVADTSWWRLTAAAASFSGLFLTTLSITYLLNVVSAVVARRALAVRIEGLGGTGPAIAVRGWDGERFGEAYIQQLVALSGEVARIGEQHLAYPILHVFHATDPSTSAPLALAELDDAVALLTAGVHPDHRPEPSATRPLRYSLDRFLTTASATAVTLAGRAPDLDPEVLQHAGIPTVDRPTWQESLDDRRREDLAELVAGAGWDWAAVRAVR